MTQLELLRLILGSPAESDDVLNYYLDCAKDIICDIRNSDYIEGNYANTQLRIAVDLFSKRGAEGQVSHGENGISRGYESSDVSPSILKTITPVGKTPYSVTRTIVI